jgi:hypothetical protein
LNSSDSGLPCGLSSDSGLPCGLSMFANILFARSLYCSGPVDLWMLVPAVVQENVLVKYTKSKELSLYVDQYHACNSTTDMKTGFSMNPPLCTVLIGCSWSIWWEHKDEDLQYAVTG